MMCKARVDIHVCTFHILGLQEGFVLNRIAMRKPH